MTTGDLFPPEGDRPEDAPAPRPAPRTVPRHPFPPRLVRASAGSGKTFALVHRTIGLLAAGVAPERILATTFTRKAAGEILGRVLLRLSECVLDRKALAEVRGLIPPDFPLDAARAQELLARITAALPDLQVETLDAFFHRIAAGHAYELGLPPDWQIGDAATLGRIRRRAIHDLLEADPTAAAELVRRLHRGDVRRSIAGQLDTLVVELHHRYLESPPAAWDSIAVPPLPSPEEVSHACGALAGIELPRTKKGAIDKRWEKVRDTLLAAIESEDDATIIANGFVAKVLEGTGSYYKQEVGPEWHDALAAPLAAVRARELASIREQNRASHELMARFDDLENARRDALGIYDFQTMTVRLASEGMLARMRGGVDRIYERIDARVDHILLDEFQDTSLFQFLVLHPILEELISDSEAQRTFYCVGDVKQAIYGWRGGRRALFDRVESMLPAGSSETLAKSWRSSPVVLEAVNRTFERIDDVLLDAVDREAATEWRAQYPHHEAERSELPGYVELRIATPLDPGAGGEGAGDATGGDEPTELSKERKRALPFEHTLDTIRRARAHDPRLSIGVLLRTNRNVAPLIDLLREEGIDASQEGGNPLTDAPAVNRVLAALHFADHPGDGAARYAVLRSRLGPFLGLTEPRDPARDAEIARELRRTLIVEGTASTVRRLARVLAPSCDDRDRQRLDQLIELAHRFGDDSGLRPSTFVERVAQTPVESPTGSPVQVMTIHRSKGLEFDVVILPQLRDSWSTPTPTLLAAHSDPALPADRITRYVGKDLARLCADELAPIRDDHRRELVTEAINLLYVAMTRARHALHLILPPGKIGEGASFDRVLRVALGGGNQEETGEGDPILYAHGDREWWAGRSGGEESAEEAAETLVAADEPDRYATEPASASVRPAASDAPSARRLPDEAPTRPASPDQPDTPTEEARTPSERHFLRGLGTTIHAFLEEIDWLSDPSTELAPLCAAARRRLPLARTPERLLDHAASMIAAALEVAEARALFDEERTRERLASSAGNPIDRIETARELAYGLGDEEERPRVGIIDRLHLAVRDGRVVAAEIIDAKTAGGTPTDGSARAALADRLRASYDPQLEAYRRAVIDLFDLEPEQVAARVLALPSGLVVDCGSEARA